MVTVYTTRRAIMVKKDVLPTNLPSKVIYSFACRQCDSRYAGRTLQHLHARIKQYVPLNLLPSEARSDRLRRGRQPKGHTTEMDIGGVATGQQPTEMCHRKRSVILITLRVSDVSKGCDAVSNTKCQYMQIKIQI